ncbi:MAG: hypothetical protein HY521_03805 [Proteobacteria bacterium]|nr:hypothetical protein [Pseudomonadota bacterium]
MRLKIFTAPTMAQAMAQVRRELGEDAIIVSSQRVPKGRGFRITAALESEGEAGLAAPAGPGRGEAVDSIRQTLAYHGIAGDLAERLLKTVEALDLADPVMPLAGAIEASFSFAPLPERLGERPFAFIGTPGSGKTTMVAKLAARAVIAGRPVRVITTDTIRAGAVAQLGAIARVLKLELGEAKTPADLTREVKALAAGTLTFIDTQAANPYDPETTAPLRSFIEAAEAEAVLVHPAGTEVRESAEVAEIFARLGATRLVATRVDAARRLGGLLAGADAAGLMFSEVSASAKIAGGLKPLSPLLLARLLFTGDLPAPSAAAPDKPSRGRTSHSEAVT